MEFERCPGCMRVKTQHPVCEHCGFDENTPNDIHQLPVGTILQSQYLVGRVLGEGGFGITYLGWDLYLDKPVAIKEYYPSSIVTRDIRQSISVSGYLGTAGRQYEDSKARFLREAKTLARFERLPNIVKIYGFFPENNTVYLVMEYAKGRTLQQQLKAQGPMSLPMVLQILEPVMQDLQKVHEAGIIHRDISPDNVMLLGSGGVRLLDFGAVRQVEAPDQESQLSKSTEAIFKQGFAPAEQYNARGSLGPWTDVYAMCATICYCLNGKVPMPAPDRAIDSDPDGFIRVLPIGEAEKDVLRRGMALRPKDRTASMEQLLTQLKASLKPGARPKKAPSSGKQKHKAPVIICACAAAAVALGAAGFFLLKPEPPAPQAMQSPSVSAEGADLAVPEATVAPTVLPEIKIPETTFPETTVPETTVPETTAPAPPQPMVLDPLPDQLWLPAEAPRPTGESSKHDREMEPYNLDELTEPWAFGTSIPKCRIQTVTFLDSLDSAPKDAADLSVSGNGAVLLWATPSPGTDPVLYDLYIAANGKVVLSVDSSYLFGASVSAFRDSPELCWGELTQVNFNGCVDSSNVMTLRQMFCGCKKLRSVDLSQLSSPRLHSTEGLFWDCSSLKEVNFKDFDTSLVRNMSFMFADCSALTELDLSGFQTDELEDTEYMFVSCGELDLKTESPMIRDAYENRGSPTEQP